MPKKNKEQEKDSIEKRLDALIKFEILKMKRDLGKKFNLQEPARLLQTSGFSPSEIADILNKKGATAIAYLLYGDNKKIEESTNNNPILKKEETE